MRGQREAAGVLPKSYSEGEVLETAWCGNSGGLPRDLSCGYELHDLEPVQRRCEWKRILLLSLLSDYALVGGWE